MSKLKEPLKQVFGIQDPPVENPYLTHASAEQLRHMGQPWAAEEVLKELGEPDEYDVYPDPMDYWIAVEDASQED